LHAVPLALQVSPAQQASPEPPQATQLPLLHATRLAVHTPPPPPTPAVQQGWPLAPQVPQEPLAQVPPMEQLSPAPAHRSFTQQPPPPQAPAEQHGWPGAPQVAHTSAPPRPVQIVPAAVQAWLGQQASPAAPHASVDVLVEVTVTVTVLVPVFVPVVLAVRVAVLVWVVVMVRPPELLEQAEAEAATSTNLTTQRAARADEIATRFVLIENPPGALQNPSTTR
jgi:hypothetical protein